MLKERGSRKVPLSHIEVSRYLSELLSNLVYEHQAASLPD